MFFDVFLCHVFSFNFPFQKKNNHGVTVVNFRFRCKALQARILDANGCDLLPEDSSHVYEVVWHENASFWTCSGLLLLLFITSNECAHSLLHPTPNFCLWEGSHRRVMWVLCNQVYLIIICFVQKKIGTASYCKLHFVSQPSHCTVPISLYHYVYD